MMDCLANIKQNLLFVALVIGVVFIFLVLYRINKAVNEVKLIDLILGEDRRASWSKMAAIGGFMVVAFVILWCTIVQHVPDGLQWLVLIFLAACVGSPIAFAIINMIRGGPASGGPAPNQEIQASIPAGGSIQISTPAAPAPQPGAVG